MADDIRSPPGPPPRAAGTAPGDGRRQDRTGFALDQRRIADAAALLAQEADARRASVEFEAVAEAVRLEKLEERLAANPHAAVYDVESARLRVAEKLAGNSRAVVSLGGGDLFTNLLLTRESDQGSSTSTSSDATPGQNGGAPKA